MDKQISLSALNDELAQVRTKKKEFLEQMDHIIPWAEVIDSRAFSDCCGVDSSNQIPSGDTLGRFRNLLIQHGLQGQLFTQVVAMLMERGLILKKGNTWHFGYKAHIGVDRNSGIVHTDKATAANIHDVTMTSELLHGEEETVNGDSGYIGAEKHQDAIVNNKAGKRC